MERKTKIEQVFVISICFMIVFIIFCATGCGDNGKSCEVPRCGTESGDGYALLGVSIPGCGGILTSGQSCGGCGLWSQAIKCTGGYADIGKVPKKIKYEEKDINGNTVTKEKVEYDTKKLLILTLDDRYYEDEGCGACSSPRARACYGTAAVSGPTDWLVAFGYPSRELSVGCGSGCGACAATARPGAYLIDLTERITEINN